jgi:hypothetical protein
MVFLGANYITMLARLHILTLHVSQDNLCHISTIHLARGLILLIRHELNLTAVRAELVEALRSHSHFDKLNANDFLDKWRRINKIDFL